MPLQTPMQTPLPGTVHTPLPGTVQTLLPGSGENSMYQLPTPTDYSSGHESVTPNEVKPRMPSPYMKAPSPWMNQRPLGVDVNVAYVEGWEEGERGNPPQPTTQDDEQDMEVDTATSVTSVKQSLPELEIYCYLLVLIFLIDQKRLSEKPLALHRIATLRHDELGQETLLNLLLRNYLHYNLYDQAKKHRSRAPHFEAHSNQQKYNENEVYELKDIATDVADLLLWTLVLPFPLVTTKGLTAVVI
ncbi:hypothetical protein IFM89_000662 [Coptis chinensis]|uniref:26S proteasome non-ATPase regulatory subunit 3 N-terminal TPR repeats domain-containing protein n=1 Tax=Coptis chinensis TaxID=261450 RepID=A0A835IM86_9MAGN|nr:hypothetical protein IFM89_000662 [Coptis chinensis]